MFGRRTLTVALPPISYSPNISERFRLASLLKICGFGALECLPKHSPVSLLRLQRLCASLDVLKRISSSLPSPFNSVCTREGTGEAGLRSQPQMRQIRGRLARLSSSLGKPLACVSLLNAFYSSSASARARMA